MLKMAVIKEKHSNDLIVMGFINQIESAMEPLATAVRNSIRLPGIQQFRLSEAALVDFTEQLSLAEHEAHMSLLRPVRALDEHLGFAWQTGCCVDAPADYLKDDFRGAVKDWALQLQGVSID